MYRRSTPKAGNVAERTMLAATLLGLTGTTDRVMLGAVRAALTPLTGGRNDAGVAAKAEQCSAVNSFGRCRLGCC